MAGADDPLRNQRSGAKNKPLVLPTTSANPPPQLPPSISLKSRILTSRILLPQSPIITYRTFDFSQPHPDPDFILECARRQIVQAWDCTEDDIAQSFLVKVALQQTPKLWIFRINSLKGNVKLFQTINELQFSGLHETSRASFSFAELFPCSAACSQLRDPCAKCYMDNTDNGDEHMARLLPRKPLRTAYAYFLDAVRDRIVDAICEKARQDRACPRTVAKLGHGLILWPKPDLPSEWGIGWENEGNQRPLVRCYFHMHFTKSQILLQPFIIPTSFVSLPPIVATGSAIALLPTCSHAYYLSDYSGPSDYLISTLSVSFAGLGVGDWKKQGYVVCWIRAKGDAQSPQGQDQTSSSNRGIMAVWPRQLCILSLDLPPLETIPVLPMPISPKSAPPTIPTRLLFSKRATLSGFRPFSLDSGYHQTTGDVASSVNGFVDAVLKSRERVRENSRSDKAADSTAPVALAPSPVIQLVQSPEDTDMEASRQFYPSPPEMNASGSQGQFSFPPLNLQTGFSSEFSPLQHPSSLEPSAYPYSSLQTNSAPTSDDWNSIMFPPETSGADATDGVGSADGFDGLAMVTDDDFSFFDDPGLSVSNVAQFATPIPSLLEPAVISERPLSERIQALASLSRNRSDQPQPAPLRTPPSVPVDDATPVAPPTPGDSGLILRPPSRTPKSRRKSKVEGPRGIFAPIDLDDASTSSRNYAINSLPSPRPDDGDESDVDQAEASFRSRYENLTNPTHHIVDRLRGLKRKSPQVPLSSKQERGRWKTSYSGSWRPTSWDSDYSESDAESTEGTIVESDDEPDAREEYDTDEIPEDSHPPRALTPPPPYLTPGPRLLHGQFLEERILALSAPIQVPEGSVVGGTSTAAPTPAPISVPTPVSPADAMTGDSESAMSETVAALALREAVENPTWAEACKSDSVMDTKTRLESVPEWQDDAVCVMNLIENTPLLKSEQPPDLSALLSESEDFAVAGKQRSENPPVLESLPTPSVTLTQRGDVFQVSPTALRFWSKLALGPLSGPKDVISYALYEDNDGESSSAVQSWLEEVGRVYTDRGFGLQTPGNEDGFSGGLVPLRWTGLRKTLGTLLSAVPSSHQVVFYVIVSPSFARYTSQPFRQLASAIIQAVKLPMIGQLDNDRVLFHFVPRHLVFGSQFPSSRSAALEQIANSVYNRVPLRIERFMPRKVFAYNALPHRAWVEAPSFTLSRPLVPTFKFTMEWPVATIADIDRHTFLHVGYLPSPCGRWLFASCVDERGQGHTNKVWLLSQIEGDDPSPEKKIVETVLDFALEFSRRANLEWRLVFARLGVMSEAELEAWELSISSRIVPNAYPLHASFVCVEQDSSFTFLPQLLAEEAIRSLASGPSESKFVDASSRAYLFFPSGHHRISTTPTDSSHQHDYTRSNSASIGLVPLSTAHLIHSINGVPSHPSATDPQYFVRSTQIHLLRTCRSTLSSFNQSIRQLMQAIARNFHELCVLSRERWSLSASNTLPFHLSSVNLMASVIAQGHILKDGVDVV